MAGFDFTVEVDDAVVRAALGRLAAAAVDMTPVMKDVSGYLEETSQERFETQRGPDGTPWKKSQRVIENPGEKTLTLDGHLLASIISQNTEDEALAGVLGGGPASAYAAIHQFGGEIRPRNGKALSFGGRLVARVMMPARPYLGVNDENATEIVAKIEAYLDRALAGSGTGSTT